MHSSAKNVRSLLQMAAEELAAAGIASARLDAELLLSFCLGCDRLEFYKNPSLSVGETPLAAFEKLIARRLKEEPVAYLTGRKEFWSFTLGVDKSVLIPRPDTEVIVEEALSICRRAGAGKLRILDVGTGSGAIILALARELPSASFVATDISTAALKCARKNARSLGLDEQIEFLQGDLFEPVKGVFDLIVSNPPYIAEDEYLTLPAGVKDYEPPQALMAGKNGMYFHEKLICEAPGHLTKNGWLLLEIGAKQEKKVRGVWEAQNCYESIDLRTDYAGLPRVMKGRRK